MTANDNGSRTRTSLRALRLSAAGGVAAALVLAVLVNILSARHYRRWDWTDDGLFTLNATTVQTLRSLQDTVEIYILLPRDDGLTLTMRHLVEAYGAHTSRLSVQYVDPDRDPAAFMAVQQKFGVAAIKTEGGRILADAAIIAARGNRRHFLAYDELFEVEQGEEMRARSRVEQVLTNAIRAVTVGEPPLVCFTTGYGEPQLEQGGAEGLLPLELRLDRLNFRVEQLLPLRQLKAADSIDDCKAVVVAGPAQPLASEDVQRLKRYVEDGGNALVFVGPELDDSGDGFVDIGLAPLLSLAGVRKRNDFVFERDPARRWPVGQGEALIAEPLKHPISEGFIEAQGAINVVLTVTSSLEAIETASVKPTELLRTSEAAFGMVDFVAWAKERPEPAPGERDHSGPLVLAFAAELPKARSDAPHGPRMVVFGTKSAVLGANWANERLQGTGLFVENTVAWLTAEPIAVEVAPKRARSVGANITSQTLRSALIKLVLLLPLATALLGAVVTLRRRLTEKRARKEKSA